MKYIVDILKIKECKHTVYRNGASYVSMLLSNVAIAILAVIMSPVFKMYLGIGIQGCIVGAVLLSAMLDIFIARMTIIREPEKKFERRYNLSNNIVKFFRVNQGSEDERITDLSRIKYSLFEHYNGVPFILFQLKFGGWKHKTGTSGEFLTKLIAYLRENKAEYVKITELEDFEDAPCWDYLRNNLANVEDNKFRVHYMQVLDYLQKTYKKVKVPTIYFKVILRTPSLKLKSDEVVHDICKLYKDNPNNFRELKFLNYNEMIRLFADYFDVENIDVTLSEALDAKNCKVGETEVIKVWDFNGNIRETKDIVERENKFIKKDIRQEVIKEKRKIIKF